MTHFPPFAFDPADRTLWRGAKEVPLTPKAAALLACLLSARGAWVTKEAILSTVWPDTHVLADNVKNLVHELRTVLGDSPHSPTYIQSVARRGYAFVAPVAERGPGAGDDWLLSPRARVFVRRDRELNLLGAALHSISEPRSRSFLISGPDGVGKTSLCDGFMRTMRAAGQARVCYGQCFDRESSHESYFPILDALHRLDRQYPQRVPAALAEHAPSWLSLFPQWAPAGENEADAGVSMEDQLCAALQALARDLPLVLVIEDVHWADTDTLRALAAVARAAHAGRVMVVATCREGVWSGDSAACGELLQAGCTEVILGPFALDQIRQYLIARFGPGPIETLAPMLFTTTGGNPRMVAAALDGLVERRVIACVAGQWRREASFDAIRRALPQTLSDLVLQQLDQLGMREREAIEAAAAAGFEFTLEMAAGALRWRPEDVAAVLAPLARRGQLIVTIKEHDAARHEDDVYCFRHAWYVGAISQHAPRLRQHAFEARIREYRIAARRLAT